MQQLCRRSLFCYYSIFEHHNLICTGNSAHPVGDDEDGFIFLSAGIFKTPFLLSVTSQKKTAAAMHQITMAVLVLLWLITDIHVATGTCMACAISGTVTSRRFHVTG